MTNSNFRGQSRENYATTMGSLPENDQTFIVRLWLESSDGNDRELQWRGVIENVQNNNRRYLEDLDEITAFIVPDLEKTGVTMSRSRKSRRWFVSWW